MLEDPSVIRQVRVVRKLSGHVFNFLLPRSGLLRCSNTQVQAQALPRGGGRGALPQLATAHFASTSSC